MKEQSLVKKTPKTLSKSAYKRQRNACSIYAPIERTVHRLWAWQTNKQKTNTTFSHLQPARIVRSSPTLHGDRARRDHRKDVIHFLDPTHSFSL